MQKYSPVSPFKCSFEHIQTSSDTTVVYTHGFCSDPWGAKPDKIKDFCLEHNISFFRYELAGHGSDTEHYMESDFNIWRDQLLDIIDNRVSGKIIVVGSSLGGWLSLIAARERPNRIVGVLGLAPAADFTADMLEKLLTPEQIAELNSGVLICPTKEFTYKATKRIFDTAAQNLILRGQLDVKCPVHIIHGTMDKNLMPDKPFQIQRALMGDVVVVKLIKGAEHRLDDDISRSEIRASLTELLRLAK